MKKIIITFCILHAAFNITQAQELNCQVSVVTPGIQESNKQIYETLQNQLREFMNTKHWTGDNFLSSERIECSILINITERVSTDQFKATMQIQSRRPVYKSSYNCPMINHQDNDFSFTYLQDQTLDFDENSINSNLIATMAFYAYVIIGFDYESFSPEGGTPYFQHAQTIVNNAQSLSDRGWKAFENNHNRYWLLENLLNVSFKPMRAAIYKYHRLGFDKMGDDVAQARIKVWEAITDIKKVYLEKPNSFLMQFFFNAKSDEVVNLFSQGSMDEKSQALQTLSLIDPGNISKYSTIMNGSK